ncbi:MAG TPA: SAM-dependent methyltransferase [Minicystis sp.]|nr:SAM-dependent methyltransferase [Minicystis sp.]
MRARACLAALALAAAGCGGAAAEPAAPQAKAAAEAPPNRYQAIVDAPDRSADDRKLDAGRHPAELLAFFAPKPGMHVAEIAAGGGYTTELLARAVGPSGLVYGVNSQWVLDRFAAKPWAERLAKPVNANVRRLDRPFDDPFPPDVKDLDQVWIVLFYHDLVWQKADRDKFDRAVFAALKPGGVFAVVDHSGRPGSDATETETLHRIEEKSVVAEVERAGFKLAREGEFLRNPADTRDWNASPRAAGDKRGTSDRFVLAVVKP